MTLKRLFRFLILVTILIFAIGGCSQDETTGKENKNQDKGTGNLKTKNEGPITLVFKKGSGGEYYVQERENSNKNLKEYDVKSLLPLNVGNSWTYSITSTPKKLRISPSPGSTDFGTKLFSYRIYASQKKKRMVIRWSPLFITLMKGKEKDLISDLYTFTVTNKKDGHYFFKITSGGDQGPDFSRDGRYMESRSMSWTWWKNSDDEIGLTELIEREWSDFPKRYLLSTGEEPPVDDFPVDDRNLLHFKFKNGKWRKISWSTWETGQIRVVSYETKGVRVKVPAGVFEDCVLVIEGVYEEPFKEITNNSSFLYTTYSFWAPNVGMVREYQKLSKDDAISYDMKLVKFISNHKL